MSNRTEKHSKKEETKKLAVRVICLVLAASLCLAVFVSMFATLFF